MRRNTGTKSYRRRCHELGKNTGLAHYILLTPRTEGKKEEKTRS